MSIRLWATLIAVASILLLLTATHLKAYRAGAASERHAILTRSVEILRERSRIDDEARTMDNAALCAALGGVWLQDDSACQ